MAVELNDLAGNNQDRDVMTQMVAKGDMRESREDDFMVFFERYFHTKMSTLFLLLDRPRVNSNLCERMIEFLDDLKIYFLPSEKAQRYRQTFEWMNDFLNDYPEVSRERYIEAYEVVKKIYEAFDMSTKTMKTETEIFNRFDHNFRDRVQSVTLTH